jgi:hypothetical protein
MASVVLDARPQARLEGATPEIALRRLANAEALSMTYREYTLEILNAGFFRFDALSEPSFHPPDAAIT